MRNQKLIEGSPSQTPFGTESVRKTSFCNEAELHKHIPCEAGASQGEKQIFCTVSRAWGQEK
ncbi:MAG: hypothetical protein K1X86_15220 [Ignavibacteria bacterium]|nr:hypothetical protein [Ignavibacteria bacterium]